MNDEVLEERAGLDRRSMIKGLGAGAALVWSAPAVMSVASASAASPACTGDAPRFCPVDEFQPVFCGPDCQCGVKVEDGSHFCYQGGGYCAPCASDADCAPGEACLQDPSGFCPDGDCDDADVPSTYCASPCGAQGGTGFAGGFLPTPMR